MTNSILKSDEMFWLRWSFRTFDLVLLCFKDFYLFVYFIYLFIFFCFVCVTTGNDFSVSCMFSSEILNISTLIITRRKTFVFEHFFTFVVPPETSRSWSGWKSDSCQIIIGMIWITRWSWSWSADWYELQYGASLTWSIDFIRWDRTSFIQREAGKTANINRLYKK